MEPPLSRMGNTEASRDSGGGPPPEDITRELQKIKLPEFDGSHTSERVEAWLEGMTRCFALRDYASNSKVKIAIFQLRDNALNWWGNLEKQLHLTPDTVSWELFEERFRRKYLLATRCQCIFLCRVWTLAMIRRGGGISHRVSSET